MAIIEKNRKIRPSTHNPSSPYRVHCDEVSAGDTLRVNITLDNDSSVSFIYEIDGAEISDYDSLHFYAEQISGIWEISWVQNVNIRQIQ